MRSTGGFGWCTAGCQSGSGAPSVASANDDTTMVAIRRRQRGNHPGASRPQAPRRTGEAGLGSEAELGAHGPHVGVDGRRHGDLADGDIGVLEAVSGQHAHHRRAGRHARL